MAFSELFLAFHGLYHCTYHGHGKGFSSVRQYMAMYSTGLGYDWAAISIVDSEISFSFSFLSCLSQPRLRRWALVVLGWPVATFCGRSA